MKISELGRILANDYAKAPRSEKVVAIHLFGIRHADEIGSAANQVVEAPGIPLTYATEVRKGARLAEHVTLKR